MKVILISVDGMRSDALAAIPKAQEMMKKTTFCLNEHTVFPSVTLPCHMSMFHSVTPERHGTTTNTYMPQVRPINGICEQVRAAGKSGAFFHNWEELRDLSRPASLDFSFFHGKVRSAPNPYEPANRQVADRAIDYITNNQPDFAFIYLGWLDEAGHDYGWLSPEYYHALESSWNDIDQIINALPEDYCVIITTDHGGHDRTHGSTLPEDMIIPIRRYDNPHLPIWHAL